MVYLFDGNMEIQAEVLFVSRANKNHNLLLTFFQGSVKGGDGLFI
jgi:hypothetical protein